MEAASPTLRNRPVTRSMGQGETVDVPSSPVRRAKRARLCSSSSSVSATGPGGSKKLGEMKLWDGSRPAFGHGEGFIACFKPSRG